MTLIGKQLDGEAPKGGLLIQGKDGSGNAQDVLVDTNGHVQVDVLSGGSSSPGTAFNSFDEDTAVASSTETTVLTYTVGAGQTANIQGFLVTGTAAGRWKLKIDGTVKAVARTTAAEGAQMINFGWGTVSAATTLDVTITAYHSETANQTMSANVFGYLT